MDEKTDAGRFRVIFQNVYYIYKMVKNKCISYIAYEMHFFHYSRLLMYYKITGTLEHIEINIDEYSSAHETHLHHIAPAYKSDHNNIPDSEQKVICKAMESAMVAITLTEEEWEIRKELLHFPSYTGFEHSKIHSCKAEAYAKYIYGSLCVPNRKKLSAAPMKLIFYINPYFIVFLDNDGLPDRIIGHMVHRYQEQEMTPEFFLYAFFAEFLTDDIELLEKYENHLFLLEERALAGNIKNLLPNILKARRELACLRNYYEQMEDLARELISNVKHYFDQDSLSILTLLSDRSEQLQDIAQQSIEYCQTLRDFEQAQSDHKQNKTIQFLTILTSIFFPLTVITGWYGMNFTYMPEINTKYGYFIVIAVSAAVIAIELIILKIKKMI